MFEKTSRILWVATIVLLLLVVWYINPFVIFERKLNFVLPDTVLIKNSSYSLFYNELKMKISFDTKEYQSIVKNVIDYAKNNMSEVNLKNGGNAISVRASCIYWEEEKEEAILAYLGFKQGKWGAKTRVTCILITKDKENKGGYFVASSGNVTDEIIQEYIKNQDLQEKMKSDNFEIGQL